MATVDDATTAKLNASVDVDNRGRLLSDDEISE
jgi:hypothetical protein